MEIRVSGGRAQLCQPEDFKRFRVVMCDRAADSFDLGATEPVPGLTFVDARTAWVSRDWLLASGPGCPEWAAGVARMIEAARPMGWVSADGEAIKAHVDWLDVAPQVSDAFRCAMRRLAATPCLITTAHNGRRHGMAATSVTSLSFDPPSILVCVNLSASIHDPLQAEGRFCANLMGGGHTDLLGAFSGGLKGEGRFGMGDWQQQEGLPYLSDAQSNIFCRVADRWRYGTHTIFVGQVEAVRTDADMDPMIYLDGRKGRFASI